MNETRQERGLMIAALSKITRKNGIWQVPSRSGKGKYAVKIGDDTDYTRCSCPDYETNACKCKHKCHMMCGVKTNVVTAVEIHDRDASDTKLLPALVETTAKNFKINEVSADKGYSSINNTNVIAAHGAVPFIAFKSIHTGAGGGLWEKMYHFFRFKRSEFLAHYHKRSNVESTINMIKAKFRDHVRSKTDVAMKNEVLCKVLCHNICCLISAVYELGITPTFPGLDGQKQPDKLAA